MVGGCVLVFWVDNLLRRCSCYCSYRMCKLRTPALYSWFVSHFAFIAISFVCTFLFYFLKVVSSFLLCCNFKLIQQWGSWSCHLTGWQCALSMFCQIYGKICSTQSNWMSCISSHSSCISQIFFQLWRWTVLGFFCLNILLFHAEIVPVLLKALYDEPCYCWNLFDRQDESSCHSVSI